MTAPTAEFKLRHYLIGTKIAGQSCFWYDFPVKRLLVTVLIALYTVMLMWSSAGRTYTWAAMKSEAFANYSEDTTVSVSKPRTVSAPHQLNRRIVESQFVVEPPVVALRIVLIPEALHQSQELLTAGTEIWQSSGRGPPRSL